MTSFSFQIMTAQQGVGRPLDHQGLPEGYRLRSDWELTPRQVYGIQCEHQPFVLIDCRMPAEYEIAHITGSKLSPLGELSQHLADFQALASQKLVVYCHAGGRSMQMTQLLRQQGLNDVWSMAGGIDLWACDIDPSMKRYAIVRT